MSSSGYGIRMKAVLWIRKGKRWSVATLLAIGLSSSFAHDVRGLMEPRSLPQSIQAELNIRHNIRLSQRSGNPNLLESSSPVASSAGKDALRSKYESLEGVLRALAIWPQNSVLRVCFMNGTKDAQDAVWLLMREVVDLSNLRLEKVACGRQMIRVSFRHAGFSSYVGTDALLIPTERPTVVLENLDNALPLSGENQGRVRHETMHALGALHEHQHPDSNCESEILWDVVKQNFGWSDEQMQVNFKNIIRSEGVRLTPYDKDSIMHYQLSTSELKSGNSSTCLVSSGRVDLSEGDKNLIQLTYPRVSKSR